jgi:protein lifeguard
MSDLELGHSLLPHPKHLGNQLLEIKQSFAKKVFSILSVQLLFTAMIAGYFATRPLSYLLENEWIFFFAVLGSFFLVSFISFFPQSARNFPVNFLILSSFTVMEALIVGFAAGMYDLMSILIATSATAGIFILLTTFAFFTKLDLTGLLPFLWAMTFALLIFGMFFVFVPIFRGAQLLYGFAASALFSFYIIVDCQMIFRGENDSYFTFTVDDYIFAAIAVYLDIVNLFVNLLSLIGNRRSE